MIAPGSWSYPTSIHFGAGAIAKLADSCKALGMKNPLLVTDRGLKDAAITKAAMAQLAIDQLFADIDPNPHEGNLAAGLAAYKAGAHDGVVAFGGGSALDVGKLIAFMAGQSRPVWDFEDIGDWWTRADPDTIAPIIAVPTTAGTGSEVGRAAVLTNSQTKRKKIIFHPKMLPGYVIADPNLTTSMPTSITVGTGLDAFAHCVEAYSSPHYHPMSQGIALEGMRLVLENLPRVFTDPNDIEARTQMMSAAMMGAVAFQKGLGAIHALSHPVGAAHETHHGTTNAVCMPAVLAFNAAAIRDRFDQAASYLSIDGGFDGFCTHVDALNTQLGIPKTLGALGVKDPDIPKLIEDALSDPSCGGNPVKLDARGVETLLSEVL